MNDDVTTYIENLAPWQVEVAQRLRELVHQAVPDVEERLQYGKPHFLRNGHYAAVVHAAKAKVTFMVFNADGVEPAAGTWRALGKGDRKAMEITEGQALDETVVADVLGRTASTL